MIQEYSALLDSKELAKFVVDKLSSYGIEAHQTDNDDKMVTYFTTPKRYETIRKLMDFWTGLRNEWWYPLEEDVVVSFYRRGPYSQCRRAHDGSWEGGMDVLRYWAYKYNGIHRHKRHGKYVKVEG